MHAACRVWDLAKISCAECDCARRWPQELPIKFVLSNFDTTNAKKGDASLQNICPLLPRRTYNHKPCLKPFTPTEARAKRRGERLLIAAHLYVDAGELESAIDCCIAAARLTCGIPRYLMVMDQVEDLLDTIDPFRIRFRSNCLEPHSRSTLDFLHSKTTKVSGPDSWSPSPRT